MKKTKYISLPFCIQRCSIFALLFFTVSIKLVAAKEWKSITDSVYAINEVISTSLRYEAYSTGSPVYRIDTSLLQNTCNTSLADVLLSHSAVSIHDKAGIAVATMRGGNDKHTLLVWNGFGIRSATLGGLNYSTIPSDAISELSIQHGGSGTMYGSGAATGLIFASNNLDINNSGLLIKGTAAYGSFNTIKNHLRVELNKKHIASSFNIGYTYSENNFEFINSQKTKNPTEKLEHAALKQFFFSQSNTIQLYTNGKLESHLWYTNSQNLVPSIMSSYKPGTEEQYYHDIRGALIYSHYYTKGYIKTRIGVFSERNIYYNRATYASVEIGDNKAITLVKEVEGKYAATAQHAFYGGVNHTTELGMSLAYLENKTRNKTSFFGAYRSHFFNKHLSLSLEGRQEIDGKRDIPFIYSLSLNQKIWGNLHIKGNLSKHFVLPTLNDLFWGADAYAVGNPNLKPESGWNYEIGSLLNYDLEPITGNFELTVFKMDIDDEIVWESNKTTGKYTPVNRDHINAKGFELYSSTCLIINSVKITLSGNYSFTDAVSFEHKEDSTYSFPKIYTPRHKINLTLQTNWKNYYFQVSENFASKRNIDGTGSFLEEYTLLNARFAYQFKIKNTGFSGALSVNNIQNTTHQLSSGYPQPGRNYMLSFTIHL